MKQFFIKHRGFLSNFVFWWIVFGFLQLFSTQKEIILGINKDWSSSGDLIMPYITLLGDGLFAVIIGVICLLFSYRVGCSILSTYVFSGLLVQFLKRVVFPNAYRPPKVFVDIINTIHQVPGVVLHQYGSFPSGHTTSAFAVFATLAFYTKNNAIKRFFFIPPFLVAYSRMYLFVHFPLDVWVGAMLGVITAALSVYYLEKFSQNFKNLNWQKGLISSLIKN